MLMARLDKLSHDEMKTLLYRYFQKVPILYDYKLKKIHAVRNLVLRQCSPCIAQFSRH